LKKQKDFKTTLRGIFMSKAKLSYEERIAAIKEYREGKGSYKAIAKKYGIAAGMRQSMSRVGRCIDNGPMEGY
jgi:transposase-like protein